MVLFLVGRLFSTYAMNVGFQFTVEVMPTCLRGQGNALVNVMSMVSQMASPYIVYSVKTTDNRGDSNIILLFSLWLALCRSDGIIHHTQSFSDLLYHVF